jgi:hypothetical protein
VSRNTIPGLVKDRRLRTITVNGQPRIPASEVERIQREGTSTYQAARPKTTKRPAFDGQAPLARDLL